MASSGMSTPSSLSSFTTVRDDTIPSAFSKDTELGNTTTESKAIEEKEDAYLVTFDEDDKEDPKNWSSIYKAVVVFQLGMLAFCANLGSSITSPANKFIAQDLRVSDEVMVLTVSMYVLGFVFGPLLWAGISEVWGRKISILPPMLVLSLFSLGTGFGKSAASVITLRFFGGIFASAPISNVVAAIGDLYEPSHRGTATALYAIAVIGGAALGPVIGAAIVVSLSWHWVLWILAIIVFSIVCIATLTLPETYAPVLLKKKARRLRKEGNNQHYYHPHEHLHIDVKSLITRFLSRPLQMIFTEPMAAVFSIYAGFVYSILYMSLEWIPIIYQDYRGFSTLVGSLPFIAYLLGIIFALSINIGNQRYYRRAVEKAGGHAVPEARLPPMQIGSILLTAGLFWLGWTADPKYHWMLPTVAFAVAGLGYECIFLQSLNVMVDTCPAYAASAVSATTIMRSLLSAGMPLAVAPMNRTLGVPKSFSILGALAGAAIPVPFLLRHYGARLRKRSKFANP